MSTTPAHTAACYITERDAAHYTTFSIHSLRQWRVRGRGPAYVRVGRSIRYRTSDLDEWLGSHRVPTPTRD